MIKHLWKSQEGAVAVIVGILFTVILGFVGLALDIGNLFVIRRGCKTRWTPQSVAAAYY